jgi:hypothetical protein
LWSVVALEVREHLVLSGGEVHVGHKLLQLAEIEVAKASTRAPLVPGDGIDPVE